MGTFGERQFKPLRIRFSSFLGVAAVLAAVAIPHRNAVGADDHGNTPATATLIGTDGIPIGGVIDPSGDLDYFRFQGLAGRFYRIETSNLQNNCDTYLILFDSDGVTILAEDDQGGEEPNASRIHFACNRSGQYFVEVSHFFLSGTGSYDLAVEDLGEVPEDDHGNEPATATLIRSGTPVLGSHEIPLDVDFFAFVPQVGNFYNIETSNLSIGSDTYMVLFDPDGETIIASDDQGGRELNASRIVWLAPSIEPYYISVSQFFSWATGDYQLLVSDLGSPRSATPDGEPQTGYLPKAGDVSIFTFAARAGIRYFTQVQNGSTGGFRIAVRAPDGLTEIARSSLGTPSLEFVPESSGDYFILVSEEMLGGDYQLTLESLGLVSPFADFDYDGMVGPADLMIFMGEWHRLTGPE